MPESLPSLELLAAEADRERDAVLRHADAIDTKAGVLLGAAVALTVLGSASTWRIAPLLVSVFAALAAVGVLWPRRFPTTELRSTRNEYLTSEPRFTTLMLLDATIDMVEATQDVLARKVVRLRMAAALLVAAGTLQGIGTILGTIGG